MKMSQKFLKKLQNFVFHKELFKQGDKIVISFSGGPDSTALALALLKLQKKMDLSLLLFHVNYGLRGEDSDGDQAFAEKFAADNGLDLKVIKYSLRKKRGNLEEQLRNFRYKKVEELRMGKGFDYIAVGHNMNDQAETFILNLLRGSGMKGLGAMKEKRGRIIRPLLFFSREEILEFLRDYGQKHRIDKSNKSSRYLRNKIRNNLIPYLEKNYFPDFKKRIFDVCENLRDDFSLLERSGLLAYNKAIKHERGKIIIDTEKTKKLQRAEVKFLFRKTVEEMKGDLRNVSASNFFEFEKILKSQKSKRQLMCVGSVIIERKGNKIIASRKLDHI